MLDQLLDRSTIVADLTKFIRRYTSLSNAINCLANRKLTLMDPQTWDDRNDRYFMARYKEGLGLRALYGVCAARCGETYHHWRVFTSGFDGVCIEIKRKPLEAELERQEHIRFSSVDYLKLGEVDQLTNNDLLRLPFVKRAAFEPEREYRIVAHSNEEQQAALDLELQLTWINRVVINPWMPAPVAGSVIAALKGICTPNSIQIIRSRLLDNSRWRRAGDRVVAVGAEPQDTNS